MSHPPNSLTRSTQRPIPLRMRRDLTIQVVPYQGQGDFIVKDPIALEYFRLREEQYATLTLLDGQRSLEGIRTELQRRFPTLRPTLVDIQRLVQDLHQRGLVISERTGQAEQLLERARRARWQRVRSAVANVLYIKLPGWDPEPLLRRLYPLVRWAFHPAALTLALLAILAGWTLLVVHFGEFERRLPAFQQFFTWPNLAYLWGTLGVAKLFHELAHGLACKHYGGECHEIGAALLVFSPCLYCDVSDSWTLSSKWQRIAIASAGMFAEILLSAAALGVWWYTSPGLLHHLALNVFLVTTITTVIFNANPLLKFDGYYILSDLLEIPNLRGKADRLLRDTFARICLGIHVPRDPFLPDRGRAGFVLYSLAAALYRWFLAFAIIVGLYRWLKPFGLQNLGLMLGGFSVLTILTGLAWSVFKLLTMPRRRRMSYVRAAATLATVFLVAAVAVAVPLPQHVEAPFVLEPAGVQHVYVSTSGRLVEVLVRPGDRVQRGQVLARQENLAHSDEVRRLKVAVDIQELEVRMQQILSDKPAEELAAATLGSLKKRLADSESQLRQLELVAPCDGIVVAPPNRSSRTTADGSDRLPQWDGSPLDSENLGCWLEPRTHLLSVAPNASLQAVLLVDQADRNSLRVGDAVELQFDGVPGAMAEGRLEHVSGEHVREAPSPLSNKFGGPLPTLSDERGRETLTTVVYQAAVTVDEPDLPVRPGARGTARAAVESRTAAEWLWRELKQTFHFKL